MRKRRLVIGLVLGGLVLLLAGCAGLFNEKPVAKFTYSPAEFFAGKDVVSFDASRSYDPDGEIVSYTWDFGDGTGAKEVRVKHKYATPGNYTVTLTVEDNFGATAEFSQTLCAKNPNPEIREVRYIDHNRGRLEVGDWITLYVDAVDVASVIKTMGLDPKRIVEIKWDLGDGTVKYGERVEHCYEYYGNYLIKVTVKDEFNAIDIAKGIITVYCRDFAPTALFTVSPSEIHVGDIVTLNGSASHDNDRWWWSCSRCGGCATEQKTEPECHTCPPPSCNRIRCYKWQVYIDGSLWKIFSGAIITFEAPQTGSYTVRLEVKDDEYNTDEAWKSFEVLP